MHAHALQLNRMSQIRPPHLLQAAESLPTQQRQLNPPPAQTFHTPQIHQTAQIAGQLIKKRWFWRRAGTLVPWIFAVQIELEFVQLLGKNWSE